MKHTLTLFLISFSFISFSQTTLTGGNISGVLTASGSPYLVTGDLTILEDSLLTIEPGVYMDFADTIKLIVRGNINSEGTAASPITLTCTDSLKGWGGVIIINKATSDTNRFDYCNFSYTSGASYDWVNSNGQSGRQVYAAINSLYSSPIVIQHSDFFRHRVCIRTQDNDITVSGSKFRQNVRFAKYDHNLITVNCIISYGGNILIDDCEFRNNHFGVALGDVLNDSVPNISNCYFEDNQVLSLQLSNNGSAKNCTFYHNGCELMRLFDWSGVLDSCIFEATYGECIPGKNIGLVRDCSLGLIVNCTFKNSVFEGVNNGDIVAKETDVLPIIKDCIFSKSGGIQVDGTSDYFITGCIFNECNNSIATSRNGIVANCAFINNNQKYLIDSTYAPSWAYSSGMIILGGSTKVYNSIFYGNRTYDGDNINATLVSNGEIQFYNCIVEGGTSSINKDQTPSFTFTGTYQDCIETYPNFADTANGDFHMTQSCSELPTGFNKGYALPIAKYYRGTTYSDILSIFKDLDGNPRIWADTVDIGPYETQALASRIDIDLQPIGVDICEDSDVLLTAKARSETLFAQWQKSVDDGAYANIGNMTTQAALTNLQIADSGTKYRVAWANLCNDYIVSNEAIIQVHSPRVIDLGEDFTMPKDSTVVLTVASDFTSYEWSTGEIGNGISFSGTELGNGSHSISITTIDQYRCESADSITITVVSGAGVETIQGLLSLYPNPAADVLYLKDLAQGEVTIHTMNGIQVLSTQVHADAVDVSSLPSGMYLIHVMHNGKVYRTRFVKE